MKILNFHDIGRLSVPVAMSIGNFDGIHLGHQALIRHVQDYAHARNMPSLVLSFYPHPLQVLTGKWVPSITVTQEKRYILEAMGVDMYVELPFDKPIAMASPVYFAEGIIFHRLNCKALFVGEGFRFGKNRLGDNVLLQKVGQGSGAHVYVVPHSQRNGEKISSTAIRESILQKHFGKAEGQMGRAYFIMGEIVTGRKLGRELGFPTVNMRPSQEKLLPPNGVYITKTCFRDQELPGVTNIGVSPTVTGRESIAAHIETHLLDFHGDLYGENARVYFYEWIRDEIDFHDISALRIQIGHDVGRAKLYFRREDAPDV